jgi:DNA-directed RNA polymerase sigma subunit (sigma70/sigma32)
VALDSSASDEGLTPPEEHAFGLHGTPPHTLKEMGETLGISPERVRQLRARALLKLRRHFTAAR